MKSKFSYYRFLMVTLGKSLLSKHPNKTYNDEVSKLSKEDLVQFTLYNIELFL